MNLKKSIINTTIIFLLCSLFHFGYDIFPNFITSIFCPVNESIWEHLKMIFTASIVFSILEKFRNKKSPFLAKGYLRGMFTIIILLIFYLPIYYSLGEVLIITMILLFLSIFISEIIVQKLPLEKHQKTWNIIGGFLIVLNFILFTYLSYHPLKIDLFYDHKSEKYGIDTLNQ